MSARDNFIYQFNNGFKFRVRIPKELRFYFDDKLEITKSIPIPHYRNALKVARVYRVEFDKLLIALKLNHSDKAITKELVNGYYLNVLNIRSKGSKEVESNREVNYSYALDKFVSHINATESMADKNRDEMSRFFDGVLRCITKELVLKLVDIDDLNYIKSRLKVLPRRTKQPYKTMTPQQLVKVKNLDEKDRVGATTLKKYLKWVRRFFRFTHASRFVDIDIAPFLESPKSELSAQLEREAFSIDEVNRAFSVVDRVLDDLNLRLIYKLLAYTGMRISEIAKAELKCKDGIYYIDLTEEVTTLKTKSSHRMIPLHKELIKLEIHKKYKDLKGLFRDEFISRKFRERVKPLVSDNPRKTLYSFRHTVATQLKYKDVNPLVISEILGHSHEGMTMGRYASRYPVEILKEAIDKLEF